MKTEVEQTNNINELIKKHLETPFHPSFLASASVTNYANTGRISGTLYMAIKEFTKEYSDQQTSQLKEQLSIEKMNSENSKDSYNVIIHELKEQLAAKERESINFAAYLSVNNYESSNGINYNKFRMEYGSKYIITTKHIDDIYKDFINTPK